MILVYIFLVHLHVASISRIIDNWMQTVIEEEESGCQFNDFMTVSTMRNLGESNETRNIVQIGSCNRV